MSSIFDDRNWKQVPDPDPEPDFWEERCKGLEELLRFALSELKGSPEIDKDDLILMISEAADWGR